MSNLTKRILISFVGVVVLGVACFFLFFNKKTSGNKFKLEEATTQSSSKKEKKKEQVEIVTSNPQKELEKTLEKPDEEVTGEEADKTKEMIQKKRSTEPKSVLEKINKMNKNIQEAQTKT